MCMNGGSSGGGSAMCYVLCGGGGGGGGGFVHCARLCVYVCARLRWVFGMIGFGGLCLLCDDTATALQAGASWNSVGRSPCVCVCVVS